MEPNAELGLKQQLVKFVCPHEDPGSGGRHICSSETLQAPTSGRLGLLLSDQVCASGEVPGSAVMGKGSAAVQLKGMFETGVRYRLQGVVLY